MLKKVALPDLMRIVTKERYTMGFAEEAEGNLNANNLRLAYRVPKKLCSTSTPRVSSVRSVDGHVVSSMAEQQVRWANYFEQLCVANHPTRQLQTARIQTQGTNLLIDLAATSLGEVREAVLMLRGGKAPGVGVYY